MGQTPTFKGIFWGGSKICRQASCFACGDAKLQHLRDLQPIVLIRESIQGHGPTIAEPCIPYCGGGGGGGGGPPPPIKQKLGLCRDSGFRVEGLGAWGFKVWGFWQVGFRVEALEVKRFRAFGK